MSTDPRHCLVLRADGDDLVMSNASGELRLPLAEARETLLGAALCMSRFAPSPETLAKQAASAMRAKALERAAADGWRIVHHQDQTVYAVQPNGCIMALLGEVWHEASVNPVDVEQFCGVGVRGGPVHALGQYGEALCRYQLQIRPISRVDPIEPTCKTCCRLLKLRQSEAEG